MLAFTNTIETKDIALAAMAEHKKADQLIQGRYWKDGRGCAVGCHYHSYVKNPNSGSALHEAAELLHVEDVVGEVNQFGRIGVRKAHQFIEAAVVGLLPVIHAVRIKAAKRAVVLLPPPASA